MTANIFNYFPNFFGKDEEQKLLKYLDETYNFVAAPQYTNKGITRYQKWYQTDHKYFCPEWKQRFPQWTSFEIDETIALLIKKMQTFITDINPKMKINSCLINKYPDGNHYISPHRDSPSSFGSEPTIIILSLGDTRTLMFEHNENKENISFDLESGSIFVMSGTSQKDYLHSLQKSDSTNVRYSLTFREFIL